MDCIRCSQPLPSDGRFLTCAACQNGYHLSKACSGVADSTFSGMGASKREGWKCPTCRSGELRSSSCASESILVADSSLVAENQQRLVADASVASPSINTQLASIGAALNDLLSLKTSVEALLPLPAKVDQLLALQPAVEELRSTVSGLQTTVASFGEKYESVLALAKTNEESVKNLHNEVGSVRTTMLEQSREIERLKQELNDSQQYSRRCNMEVHGLPFTQGENLIKVMEDLSVKLNLPLLQSSDILAIHRLPKRTDLSSTVLVSFASPAIKNVWMAARGGLRRLSQPAHQLRLFFNDNLTAANRELFWMARSKGKESGFRFVWIKNAKIFAKKEEGSLALRISTVRDIEKIV